MAGIPDDRLGDSLLDWISSFDDIEGEHLTIDDLSDGVACAEVLAQLIPDKFTKSDLANIHKTAQGNRLQKIENLRKLKNTISTFYDVDLQTPPAVLDLPNVEQVEAGDLKETLKLLELLLGVAVQCKDRDSRVRDLMALDVDVKTDLMASIKQLMDSISQGKARLQENIDSMSPDDMKQVLAEKDEIERLYNSLKEDHELLTQKYDEATHKLETASQQTGSVGTPQKSTSSEGDSSEKQLLHSMRSEMEEYKHTLAHERNENATTVKELNKTITELRRQMERAEAEVGNAERLRDEMEELRLQANRADKLESKLEAYREKLEQFQELNEEVKGLRAQNSSLTTQVTVLEEGGRKSISLQQTVAKYKEQISELEAGKLEEEKRGDALLSETRQLRDALEDVENENRRLHAERRELSGRVRDLEESAAGTPLVGDNTETLGAALASSSPETSELREQISRLEAQNAMLKAQSEGDSEFQKLLDESSSQKAKLATENRTMNMQVLELKAEVEKLKKKGSRGSGGGGGTDELAIEQLATAERALRQANARVSELETDLKASNVELLQMKKEASMMGLDQKEMVAEATRKAEESAKAQLDDLTSQITAAEAKIAELEKERDQARGKLEELQTKHEKVLQQRDEKMEELNSALRQNNELTNQLHNMNTEGSEKLMKDIEARLKAGGASPTDGGGSQQEVLQLQLKIAQLEKESMGAAAKADRDRMEAVASLKEQIASKETIIHDLKEKVRVAETELAEFKSNLGKQAGAELSEAVDSLKAQLDQKAREYETERENNLKLKAQYDREQQLMVSAWYDLVQQNQRLLSRPQGASSGGGISFLQRQRQLALSTPRK